MAEAEAAIEIDGEIESAELSPGGELTEPVIPEKAPEKAPEPEDEAGEAEPEAKKVAPLTPEQQASVNEAIGRKVAKQREAERKAEEAERKLQEAQNRLAQFETQQRPNIPPPPDPYDDNFQEKVQHRDALIAHAAQWDAQQQFAQQQHQNAQAEAQRKAHEQTVQSVQSYSDKATKLGIKADELKQAGAAVAEYGIPDRIALRILKDDRGPEITTYLSKNLMELDELSRMEPEDAAVYIETVIKPKAKREPKKLAPEPTEALRGSVVPNPGDGPPGVTYE